MALIQSSKTIRPLYESLSVSVSLKADPTKTPVTQEMVDGAYQPDRSLVPTVLIPTVNCAASDGSLFDLSTGNGNQWLTGVTWLLDGADISTRLSSTATPPDYAIVAAAGADCGKLTLNVNTPPGTVWTLQFKATLVDPRNNGATVQVVSDQVELTTLVSADDRVRVVMDTEDAITYDPVRDLQLLDDYCAANGYDGDRPTAAALAAARHRCYRHTFPARIICGGSQLNLGTDYLLRVYAVTSAAETLLDVSEPGELVQLDYNADGTATVTLDLSVVANCGYVVKAVTAAGSVVAVKHIGVLRRPSALRLATANDCSLLPGHDARADRVIAHDLRGRLVKHPELYQEIAFYGDAEGEITSTSIASGRSVLLGTGREAKYRLSSLGVDVSQRRAVLHTAIATEERGAFFYLADENGDYLADENGDYLVSL